MINEVIYVIGLAVTSYAMECIPLPQGWKGHLVKFLGHASVCLAIFFAGKLI